MNASPVRALLSVLVAAATVVVIAGVSVVAFLNPIWVGFEQDRAGAAALTGLSPDQLHAVTGDVLHDLIVGPPAFAQTVAGTAAFSDRERAHLVDVRTVFIAFGAAAVLGVLILVNARLASGGAVWCRRAIGTGALVLAGAVVIGGIVLALAFEQAFEVFHELFFAGGTYTFDPATDRLVQLFPSQFWEETSLAVGVVILVVSGVVAWWAFRWGEA
ncbi:MAG: lipoprotein intramolecular transacylase Lit [Candidatus Limnocylindrales bacterium]